MPEYIVTRITEALNTKSKSTKGAKVLMLGVTYKKDTEDLRESPSLRIMELLVEKGAGVSYHDPYVTEIKIKNKILKSIKLDKKELGSYDCVVITADHSYYDLNFMVNNSKLIFDTRGCTVNIKANNIIRLGE
jgi:UDP-N-acetyl-D-glucosamine dehydrogenase